MSQITLSSLFQDGVVLQRNAVNKIWGKAIGEEELTLVFRGFRYRTTVETNGCFCFVIDSLKVGGPDDIIIQGRSEVAIHDVLVGDLYLLGGQSNMELPVSRVMNLCGKEVYEKDYPLIRHFKVPQQYEFHGEKKELDGGSWSLAKGDSKLLFSAAGFFFAKEIYEQYHVPIGLIETAVGGTPIESWMKAKTVKAIADCGERLKQLKKEGFVEEVIQSENNNTDEWYAKLKETDLGLATEGEEWYQPGLDRRQWKKADIPFDFHEHEELDGICGAVWFHRECVLPDDYQDQDTKLYLGTMVDADEVYVNGTLVGTTAYQYPPREYEIPKGILKAGRNDIVIRLIVNYELGGFVKGKPYELRLQKDNTKIQLTDSWSFKVGCILDKLPRTTFFSYEPSGMYQGMIAPLRGLPITAVLWYQGESNGDTSQNYAKKMELLIEDWRENFQNTQLPFFFVQLANFGKPSEVVEDSGFASVRDEQRKAAVIPYTAMVSAVDIGAYNDLHPEDKKTLGYRLALCAKRLVYHEDLEYCGPMIESAKYTGDHIALEFTHIGSGLRVKERQELLDEGELSQFFVAEEDRNFRKVEAKLNGDGVVLKNIDGKVRYIRYAWSSNPVGANLYNAEGLPASPFEIALNSQHAFAWINEGYLL